MDNNKKYAQQIDSVTFPPACLVILFDNKQWESFIEDCCRVDMGIGKKYSFVQMLGGAGDAGRDIEARYQEELKANEWDLYQGKHLTQPVGESTLYPELAKVIHHISIGTYPEPKNYYICAPRNTTPKLHDLLAKPEELKRRFINAWENGKSGIKKSHFPFSDKTKSIANSFDYRKIKEFPVKDLIALHSKDSIAHEKLFGISAVRTDNPDIPDIPATLEHVYLNELMKVYSEHGNQVFDIKNIMHYENYKNHLIGCRTEFYSAEGLKRFSRDIYPSEFEKLLCSVHQGIMRTLANPTYSNSFQRLENTLEKAATLQITDNPLSKRLLPVDLPGTCHHLVNEEKIKWTK